MTPEDIEGKKTLEEVPTYAELKHDPKSNLPDSFTICSTIMDTNCHSEWFPLFFNLLDNQFETQLYVHGESERPDLKKDVTK